METRCNGDRSDERSWWACACGARARLAGRRAKRFVTVLGPVTLERAYYCCPRCHAGFCPRDRALGLDAGSLSPGVRRMVGSAAAEASFAAAGGLLHDLAGVAVDAKQAERAAEALGGEIADDERRTVSAQAPSAPTMHLGMDGTGIPVRRSEVAGRAGKQPDGSAKTREVKLVAVWTAEGTDAQGVPQRDAGSVSYSAAIESAASLDTDPSPSAFAGRVAREARRRGFDCAARRAGRRRALDLEDRRRDVPRRRPDRRSVPRQGASAGRRQGSLRRRRRPRHALGAAAARRMRVLRLGRWSEPRRLDDEPSSVFHGLSTGAVPSNMKAAVDGGRPDDLLAALGVQAASSEEARKCLDYVRWKLTTTAAHAHPQRAGMCRGRDGGAPRASPPASSKQAASTPSAPVSSRAACTGRSPAATPSSPCAAASSAQVVDVRPGDARTREARVPVHLERAAQYLAGIWPNASSTSASPISGRDDRPPDELSHKIVVRPSRLPEYAFAAIRVQSPSVEDTGISCSPSAAPSFMLT